MSFFTNNVANYLDANLASEAPSSTDWKLITAWVYIATGTPLGSQNVIADLMAYDSGDANTNQSVPQCVLRFSSSRNFQVLGRVNQSGSNTIVNSGFTIPENEWTLCAALCPPDDGTNRSFYAYANDPTINSGNANGTSLGATSTDWNKVRIGNEQPLSPFRDTNANVAEVAVFVVNGADDVAVLTNVQSLLADMWNGGSPKAANNIANHTPVWLAKLVNDASVSIGSAITEIGTPTYNNAFNPTLLEPTPVDPIHLSGPNTSPAETSVTVTGTSDNDCTAQFLITSQATGQPSDSTFDLSSDTAVVTASAQYSLAISGLTSQTSYRVWVRLKPSFGNASVASQNFSTTAAAPIIASVNNGQPILEGAVFRVIGSNVGLHSAADIDGTAQTNFTVIDNDTVDITCVLPSNRRFGETAIFNIAGAMANVTLQPLLGWTFTNAANVWPIKADRFDADQPWDWLIDKQVAFDINGTMGFNINPDGRATALDIGTTSIKVFDGIEWGAVGNYTITSLSNTIAVPFVASNENVFGAAISPPTASPIEPNIIANLGQILSPQIDRGDAPTVLPSLIIANAQVFAPTIPNLDQTIVVPLLTANDSQFAPTVSAPEINLVVPFFTESEAWFSATFSVQSFDDFNLSVNDFVMDLIVEVPEPAEATLARAVRFAMLEFFRDSEIWKLNATITTVQGKHQYDIPLTPNTQVYALDYAKYTTPSSQTYSLTSRAPERVTFIEQGFPTEVYSTRSEIVINASSEEGSLTYSVVIVPTIAVDSIPEAIGQTYFETIRSGALARLLSMPGKTWTDHKTANYYRELFYQGVMTAKRDGRGDRSRPKRKVAYGGVRW